MDRKLAEAFILANTRPSRPALTPEIELQLATEVSPLWRATAETLAPYDPLPFWAFAWPGGQALARLVLDDPGLVRGRSVLDFAAGSGIAAIAAARAGAARVVAADIDPFFAAAVALNARLNDVLVEATTADLVGTRLCGVEVVLAGDIFYERDMADRMHTWFRALAGEGVVVLVGDPGRIYSPREGLLDVATYIVPTSRELEDGDRRATRIARVLA